MGSGSSAAVALASRPFRRHRHRRRHHPAAATTPVPLAMTLPIRSMPSLVSWRKATSSFQLRRGMKLAPRPMRSRVVSISKGSRKLFRLVVISKPAGSVSVPGSGTQERGARGIVLVVGQPVILDEVLLLSLPATLQSQVARVQSQVGAARAPEAAVFRVAVGIDVTEQVRTLVGQAGVAAETEGIVAAVADTQFHRAVQRGRRVRLPRRPRPVRGRSPG